MFCNLEHNLYYIHNIWSIKIEQKYLLFDYLIIVNNNFYIAIEVCKIIFDLQLNVNADLLTPCDTVYIHGWAMS